MSVTDTKYLTWSGKSKTENGTAFIQINTF